VRIPNLATVFAFCLLLATGPVAAVPEPRALPHPDSPARQQEPDRYSDARARMVREQIASSGWGREAVRDRRVLEAMRRVPRHRFVPEALTDHAYADRPLPIGYGQTISQPYIVAAMTELLQMEPGDRVLEIGTGSGYQAAVLAALTDSVFSIEIVAQLAAEAAVRLRKLGYVVSARQGDGYFGWSEHAPFDAIVVTAAASHIPPPLVEQLAPGGRMVIPVGPPLQVQSLVLVEKKADGSVTQRSLMPVRFVPLTRSG
jgi:protein-L-isoaspartate(D-aspartate) O-methyltransferase